MIAGFRFGMFRREILHTKEHVVETWPNCAKHTPSGNLPPSCDMWGVDPKFREGRNSLRPYPYQNAIHPLTSGAAQGSRRCTQDWGRSEWD